MKHEQSQSMHSASPATSEGGFSAIEIILASTMLLVLTTVFANAVISGTEGTLLSAARTHATYFAEEGLEAVRNIKEESFSNLTDGTYGLATSSNRWIFSGSQDVNDIFTRQLRISTVDANTKKIESSVSWQQNLQRNASTTLATYLTNWTQITATQADTLTVNVSGASLSGDNKEARNIELRNTGSANAIITHMTVSWTNSQKIEQIRIDENTVWSKNGPGSPTNSQVSGTQLNIQDFTLQAGHVEDIDNIKFSGSMAGARVTIILAFGDGSEKTFTVF